MMVLEEGEKPSQSDQTHRGHCQAHHCATKECDSESLGRALILGCQGCSDIRLGGGIHSDESSNRGGEGTEKECQ